MKINETMVTAGVMNNFCIEVKTEPYVYYGTPKNDLVIVISAKQDVGYEQLIKVSQVTKEELIEIGNAFIEAANRL